jgi:hypothetical protein
MNLLIIGGSNSVKKLGYTKFLFEELIRHTSIDKVSNISLGANTCLMGLISLIELSDEYIYDVIVIEYSVNDYAMTARGDSLIWSAAFEGLIRNTCCRWPKAIICYVMLGRSNVEKPLWENQLQETRNIVAHYPQVVLSDVQAYLPELVPSDRLYEDPRHISQEASEIAGSFVANLILSKKCLNKRKLPSPLSDSVFDKMGVIDFSDFENSRNRMFSNSLITLNTMEISIGEYFEFSLPGPLISLVFVSTQGVGSLLIESEEQSAVIHTLHGGVRDGKHPFLPLSTYGSWWRNTIKEYKIKITSIPHHQAKADWPTNLGVSSLSEKPTVFLSKVLYRIN